MEPGGGRDDNRYTITFQVWHPSENASIDGCYRLVGENTFHEIDLEDGGLVCESPELGTEIPVQPGDVVGFHIDHESGPGNRGIQLDDSYSTERVWFQENATPTGESGCMFPVGDGRTLRMFTNHAPILSVTLGEFEKLC